MPRCKRCKSTDFKFGSSPRDDESAGPALFKCLKKSRTGPQYIEAILTCSVPSHPLLPRAVTPNSHSTQSCEVQHPDKSHDASKHETTTGSLSERFRKACCANWPVSSVADPKVSLERDMAHPTAYDNLLETAGAIHTTSTLCHKA